jgi:hypothetical protein
VKKHLKVLLCGAPVPCYEPHDKRRGEQPVTVDGFDYGKGARGNMPVDKRAWFPPEFWESLLHRFVLVSIQSLKGNLMVRSENEDKIKDYLLYQKETLPLPCCQGFPGRDWRG